jgi:FkbM family methyltransferase
LLAARRRARLVRGLARAARFVLDGWHNVDYDLRRNGEARVARLIVGSSPSTVFDVGANRGEWALEVASINPDASLHCFEISSDTRAELRTRVAGAQKITVADCGLDREPGSARVKRYAGSDWYTSVYDFPHDLEHEWVEEPVTTGDAYLAEHAIARVDLLKIDAEGAEHRILEGFAEALATGRVRAIQFEYGRAAIVTRFLLRDFYELLEAYGYRLGKIFPGYVDFRPYDLADEDFRGPNYLAVRADERELLESL